MELEFVATPPFERNIDRSRIYFPYWPWPIGVFENVFLAGSLVIDASPSAIHLAAFFFSGPYPQRVKMLAGDLSFITVDYAAPINPAHLLRGDSVSLAVELRGC